MDNEKGKVIELFKDSEKQKRKEDKLEIKELPIELVDFIDFATKEGFKELEKVLSVFQTAAEELDNLVIGELFEAVLESAKAGYDKFYEILEDDVDPESLHGKERERYIESQKIRSHYLVKLYERYKEEVK